VIFQFLFEADPRGAVTGALVEHVLDVLGQRHRRKEVTGKNLSARLRVEFGVVARRAAQLDVTVLDFANPR
jgi:hypothetical protein